MSDDLVKRLREPWFTNGCERYQLEAADRIEELEAKLAKAVGVKVKPLVWEDITTRVSEAVGFNCRYQIRAGTDGLVRWQGRRMGEWEDAASIEAAKAAAQADYEARILAALAEIKGGV